MTKKCWKIRCITRLGNTFYSSQELKIIKSLRGNLSQPETWPEKMEKMLLRLRSFQNQEPKASDVWQMTMLIKLLKHWAGLLTGVNALKRIRQTILEIHKASMSANKLELPYATPNNSPLSSHRPESTLGAASALFLNSAPCSAVGRGWQRPLRPFVPLSSTLCVLCRNVCLLSLKEALLFHLLGL